MRRSNVVMFLESVYKAWRSENGVIPAKAGIQCIKSIKAFGMDPPVKPEDDDF